MINYKAYLFSFIQITVQSQKKVLEIYILSCHSSLTDKLLFLIMRRFRKLILIMIDCFDW